MTTLFAMPARRGRKSLTELRGRRDELMEELKENHAPALLAKLSERPFHLASTLSLLGKPEDRMDRAARETKLPELAFLKTCRAIYDQEHAATAASLIRATQQDLI